MADIFISYSTKDRPHALTLVERLRAAGHSVWIDQQGIDAATSWSKEIAEALEECSTFMLLLSSNSLASENVAKELAVAAELKKHIIPIELESVQLKREFLYHLTGLQRVSHTNIDAIVHVLRKYGSSGTDYNPSNALATPEPTEVPSTVKRIAVLPFEDLSPNHDNEWFSDGLTNELISTLTKLPELYVIDKQTSKMYKGAKLSSKHIAHELNVRYLVTGEVRKAGEKIRIQASLLDTTDGRTLWDEKFNGTMDDIFEIQEKTALDITQGLKLKLTPEEEKILETKMTESVEAYELYLRARYLLGIGTRETAIEAIETAEKALLIDPKFVELYILQSDEYMFLYRVYGQNPQHFVDAERLINKALEVKPDLIAAKRQLGLLYSRQGKHERAEELLLSCMREDAKDYRNSKMLAEFYYTRGEYSKAIPLFEKAHESNPDVIEPIHALCHIYQLDDTTPQELKHWAQVGLPIIKRQVSNDPHNENLYVQYAFLLLWNGQKDAARKCIEEMPEHTDARTFFNKGVVYAHLIDNHAAAAEFMKALNNGFTWFDGFESDELNDEAFTEVRATVAKKKAELAAKTQNING